MVMNREKNLNSSSMTSSANTQIIVDDEILSTNPHCAIPPHYFERALAAKEQEAKGVLLLDSWHEPTWGARRRAATRFPKAN